MKKFAPKEPVDLDPPRDDIISIEKLKEANGADDKPCWVAIKGKVYDVSKKDMYRPGGGYHILAGKDASRALAKTSLKEEDAVPEWRDLSQKEKETLAGWVDFFSQRYNVLGIVEGANNMTDIPPEVESEAEEQPEATGSKA